MNGTSVQIEVSAPTTTDSASRAAAISVVPASGKTLYLPVLEIVMPELIAPIMIPATRGIICRPATVALEPWTIWRYWGRSSRPPNMAAPITTLPRLATVKLRLPNSRSGSSASSR